MGTLKLLEVKMEETVTVNRADYLRLEGVDSFMDALNAAGVDNWSGYGDALDILEEWQEEG